MICDIYISLFCHLNRPIHNSYLMFAQIICMFCDAILYGTMLILCGIIFFAFLNICIYEINFFIHLHFDFKSIRFANEELHERFFVFFFCNSNSTWQRNGFFSSSYTGFARFRNKSRCSLLDEFFVVWLAIRLIVIMKFHGFFFLILLLLNRCGKF